jgi:hypothetical protein
MIKFMKSATTSISGACDKKIILYSWAYQPIGTTIATINFWTGRLQIQKFSTTIFTHR